MKKQKSIKKLKLEKLKITKLDNPIAIKGGRGSICCTKTTSLIV